MIFINRLSCRTPVPAAAAAPAPEGATALPRQRAPAVKAALARAALAALARAVLGRAVLAAPKLARRAPCERQQRSRKEQNVLRPPGLAALGRCSPEDVGSALRRSCDPPSFSQTSSQP